MKRNPWTKSSRQWAEIGWTAPFVIAERMIRIGAAGGRPNAANRREVRRMIDEKVAAGWDSQLAVWQQLWAEQQKLAWSLWSGGLFGSAAASPARRWQRAVGQFERAAARATSASLTPVQRRVRANAKRLQRR